MPEINSGQRVLQEKNRAYVLSDPHANHTKVRCGGEVGDTGQATPVMDVRATRTFVCRLHKILRDHDSHSNIIERFDELTKLLFLKLVSDPDSTIDQSLERRPPEENKAYASRIRAGYAEAAEKHSNIVPTTFATLRMSDRAICECATALAQVSFIKKGGLDVKGLAYEEVIKNTFDKNDNQQFFTPPTIVKFMVEMMSEGLKGDVCDPASGTAGFLIEVLKSGVPVSSLTALEVDERLAWVSGMNLFIHGAPKTRAHWLPHDGTLGRDAERFFGKFDAIITNPPFGSDFTDPSLLPTYHLGGERTSRRRGILFLERCRQLLKSGGMLAFIIDEGVLNLPSAEDVRHFITGSFKVHAIVSLPETAFMPYATVNASILFLQKIGRNKLKHYPTFFAKAEKVGRKGNGDDDYIYDEAGGKRMNSDLLSIVDFFRSFQQTRKVPSSELAYAADLRSNLRNDENGWRLDFRFHHPSRKLIRLQLACAKGRLMAISEICQERKQTVVPSRGLADQTILYTGLAHIEAASGVAHQVPTPANSLKSSVKRYEPGDIIFARMRPNLRKVALMDFNEGGYVSPECIVLTVNERDGRPIIDPVLLSVLLRSDLVYDQVMHLIAGIGRPRLAVGDLRRVVIPSASYAAQEQWRLRYVSDMSAVESLRRKAEKMLAGAARMEHETVERLAQEFV